MRGEGYRGERGSSVDPGSGGCRLRAMESTVRTLADLDEEFGLHAYCNVCHRMERLDRAVLERELGPNVELERITRGLRCSACGSRGARLYKSRSCRTMRSRRFINAEELDVDVRGPGDRASVRGSGDPDRERDRYAHQPPAPSVRPSVVRAPCPRFGRNAKNCSMRAPSPGVSSRRAARSSPRWLRGEDLGSSQSPGVALRGDQLATPSQRVAREDARTGSGLTPYLARMASNSPESWIFFRPASNPSRSSRSLLWKPIAAQPAATS